MTKRYLKHDPKKVVLVGMGPSITDLFEHTLTQEMMPDFYDEIWAINMASNIVHHDVVFWMDDLDHQEKFKPGLFSLLRRRGKPVITSRSDRKILPKSYDYPIEEIGRMALPIFGKPYLNNGVAQAIAYAIYKGVKELKIYGCDFTYPNREYAEAGRACTECWMALASSQGMRLHLPQRTSLFDAVGGRGVYGYEVQPKIPLPDGSVFQHVETMPAMGYKPEDSSGEKDGGISRSVPGVEGDSADVAGGAPAGVNGASPVPAPAVG